MDLIKQIEINDMKTAEDVLQKAGTEVLFEKGHKEGDLHPNGKWYWKSSANNGKGDWRVIQKGTAKQPSQAAATDTTPTPKPTQKVTKPTPAPTPKFTVKEMEEDIKVLSNLPDMNTKKALATKYGIESKKADEIKQEIYRQLNELHKSKTQYDAEDLKWFDRYWDHPSSPQKIKLAFKDEKKEFIEFYLTAQETTYNALSAFDKYHGYRGEALDRNIRSIRNLLNERNNASDTFLQQLMVTLNQKTKPFHDDYIDKTEKHYTKRYDNLIQLKDFKMHDYMAFFGVMSSTQYDFIANEMGKRGYSRNLKSSEMQLWWDYHSDRSLPFNSQQKPLTIFGKEIQPQEILVPTRSMYSTVGDDIHADLPSKKALDYKRAVAEIKTYKTKKEYIDRQKRDAEQLYQRNMSLVADRVRKMKMDEGNLTVTSIGKAAKGFNIEVTDGKKKIYARCIWAAENSYFVAPHFRFIVTDRTGK